jgi:hypothetical protein
MAIISMFYGVIVSLYYFDKRRHHLPHVYVKYQEELTADWELASQGQPVFKIDPLR